MPQVYEESVSLHPEPLKFNSKRVVKPLLVFAAIVVVATGLISAPVWFTRLQYALSSHPAGSTQGNPAAPAASTAGSGGTTAAPPGDSEISIPDIQVKAPVVYEDDPSNNAILAALHNGVVHYPDTALPGQPGNVVIFGHSSEDWWDTGKYKFIFVLLDKLKVGQLVYLTYQGHQYEYEVSGSQVVQPTYVQALDPTAVPTLTLITCSPVGTSLRRLVVTATQVSPALEPAAGKDAPAAPSMPAPTQKTLPSSAGMLITVFNTLTMGWESILHWNGGK